MFCFVLTCSLTQIARNQAEAHGGGVLPLPHSGHRQSCKGSDSCSQLCLGAGRRGGFVRGWAQHVNLWAVHLFSCKLWITATTRIIQNNGIISTVGSIFPIYTRWLRTIPVKWNKQDWDIQKSSSQSAYFFVDLRNLCWNHSFKNTISKKSEVWTTIVYTLFWATYFQIYGLSANFITNFSIWTCEKAQAL